MTGIRIDMLLRHTRPLAAALVLVLVAAGCGGGKAGGPVAPPVPEVGVLTVQPAHASLETELPGRTSPYRIAEVRPQIGGIVQKRLFTEGAEVAAGAPLYQIDPATYRAAESGARAGLAAAEAQAANARLLADRAESLIASRMISLQDHDNALAARRRADAEVAVAKAALEAAQINLAYTTIRAPIAGRTGRSVVSEGALVKAVQDDALTTVQQLDPIYVDVTQSSAELLRLQRELGAGRLKAEGGQAKVTLTLEDGTAYAQEGRLQFAEATVDRGTGSVLLRAVFPNPRRELLPGMFVRARVAQGTIDDALLLPQGGVTRNARGEAVVLLVDDKGLVSDRVIHTGRVIGNQWLVTEGLRSGDRVIVEGLQKAKPGMTVRAAPAGTVTPDKAAAPGRK
jgi:membrane fusion protein (multidrug efflux system)